MKQKSNLIAIITMLFLFGMIALVTNLAAPIGVIWKNAFSSSANANAIGMLGNAMNFLAYLFMGIPAGMMLSKCGYKKTALIGIATGFVGVFFQYLSGKCGMGVPGFAVYLLGAFVCGFSVCMLNTVVNPMLNLLGGGGNRGNQLCLIGGTLNSLSGTLTPMLVGALIGTVTKNTMMVDVNKVLLIAMAIFAIAFVVLVMIPIADPDKSGGNQVLEHSPWAFRHFVLGTIAIFLYVGVEVGIPGTLNFYLSDNTSAGVGPMFTDSARVAGFVAGTYWFLMLVGRFVSGFIADKVSSRMMLGVTSIVGMLLVIAAMTTGNDLQATLPVFTGSGFVLETVPMAAMLLVLCGLCTSVMWSCVFNLSTEGLGKYTALGSGIFMMMVVGGGLMPLLQNWIADHTSYMMSYVVPLLSLAFIGFYALVGSKNVNKDIPV